VQVRSSRPIAELQIDYLHERNAQVDSLLDDAGPAA